MCPYVDSQHFDSEAKVHQIMNKFYTKYFRKQTWGFQGEVLYLH